MNKRCTESSCRRTFNMKLRNGVCPYCGKAYRIGDKTWRIDGRLYNVSALFAPELRGDKLGQIKRLRGPYPSPMRLRTAKEAIEAMWRKWPELAKRAV